MSWAEHVACMGERISAFRAFVGKLKGKRPIGRARRGWEDNINFKL